MPQIFTKIPLGALFSFLWFLMLFLAAITSSVSLAQPAIAFLEDEFDLTRTKAVTIFSIITFILCLPSIFFLHRGVLDDMDFWGGNFFIVLGATIEIILFSWVFGIEKAWEEMHLGAKMKLPGVYKFIIKYITPTFLIIILGYWFINDWWDIISMEGVNKENIPYILGMRIALLITLTGIGILVWWAWRKRKIENYY
jgi:SNF family Na+-dependent transporter